jgi:hypothetical protein
MRALLFATVAVLFLALAARAADDPCSSNGYPALGIVQVTGGSADSTVYLDDRSPLGHGEEMYLEDNGIWTQKAAGVYLGAANHLDLQRGGWCSIVACSYEQCFDESSNVNGPDLFVDPGGLI